MGRNGRTLHEGRHSPGRPPGPTEPLPGSCEVTDRGDLRGGCAETRPSSYCAGEFQNESEVAAELVARAESLPDGCSSRRAIEQRLETEFGVVRK